MRLKMKEKKKTIRCLDKLGRIVIPKEIRGKFEILEELEKEDINETQKKEYEKELSNIIIKLARIK